MCIYIYVCGHILLWFEAAEAAGCRQLSQLAPGLSATDTAVSERQEHRRGQEHLGVQVPPLKKVGIL